MDPTQQCNFKERGGTDGAYKGSLYELKIILFFMIRACLTQVKFKLFSNVEGFANFDDIVADCVFKNKTKKQFFLQSKHLTSTKKTKINKNSFFGTAKKGEDFKLSKYRNEILKEGCFITKYSDYKLLFFTNACIESPNSGVDWCDESCDEDLSKLFNTRDDNDCVKHFNIEENEEILESIAGDTEFLKKICILSNQVNVEQFDKIIKKELIKLIGDHDTSLINSVFLDLCNNIAMCYKFNKNDHSTKTTTDKTITKVQVECNEDILVPYYSQSKFLDDIVASAKTQLQCLAFENKIKQHFVNYKLSNLQLCAALNANSDNSLLAITTGHTSTLLAVLEVYQIINDRSKDNTCDFINPLFVKLKDLGKVMNLFKYCTDFIIIDCEETDESCAEHVSEIEEIVIKNTEKKVVFILSNNARNIVPKSCKIVDYTFKFDSLSNETQDYLLDRDIEFQGYKVKLKDLVDKDDISSIIDCDTVVKLLQNQLVIVGEKLKGLKEETEKCYIERCFYNTHEVSNDILESKYFTDILLVTVTQLSDLGKHQDKFVKNENIDQNTKGCMFYHFSESREENKKAFAKIVSMFSDKNVHWLEKRRDQYIWLQTKGSVKNIEKFVKCDERNYVSDDIIVRNANQINIIVDSSGMGKTTVLCKIADKLKKLYPTSWIQHYDLNSNEFLKQLSKISMEYPKNIILSAAKKCSSFLMTELTKFEQNIFDHLLKKQKVIFCFDGFDEICPKYETQFLKIVSDLIHCHAKQIWLTSREHMEYALQKHLSSFSMKLLPISRNSQINFCVKYFTHHMKQQQLDEAKITAFSTLLINSLISLDESIHVLIGIPMLTTILASINLVQCIEYCRQNNEITESIVQFANIFDMYKQFFELVIRRYYEEKENQDPNSNYLDNKLKNQTISRKHMLYAVISLLDDEIPDVTVHVKEKLKTLEDSSNIICELLDIGIITNVTENKAKFLHLSLAEFLLAWFISEQVSTNITICNLQILLDEVLCEDKWKNVRSFLNCAQLLQVKYQPFKNVIYKKKTSLHIAAEEGCYNIAKFTISCLKNNNNDIKRWISITTEGLCVFRIKVQNKGVNALQIAAKKGHKNLMELLLDHGAYINVKDKNGDTLMLIAAKKGHDETVKLLLERGADVNHKNNDGDTALTSAALRGHVEIVNLLLQDPRANVNLKNNDGDTALTSAASGGLDETVKLLLERGADVNHKNNDGDTALTSAALRGRVEIVKLLLERGADVNHKINDGDTALMLAAREGRDKIVNLLLLDHELDVNLENNNGDIALTLAASRGNLETVKLLLSRGAREEDKDKDGWTMVMYAACNKHHDVFTYFIGNSKNEIHNTDNDGKLALHYAAKFGHCLNVKSLLDAGAVINCQDKKGNTPLHEACAESYSLQCGQYLVQRGADRSIKNTEGKTASDVCDDSNEIKKWLQKNLVYRNFVDEKDLTNGPF